MPRRRGGCSCIIFLALAVSIIAGVFMFPSYKDNIIPSFSRDWFKKIPSINLKTLKSWIGKTDTPSESLDIAITLKSGRKLFWSNYFEEGDSYCTKKDEGKVCIPKDDVAAIYSVRKP